MANPIAGAQIVAGGGLIVFVELSKSDEVETRRLVVLGLQHLSAHGENHTKILTEGCLELLVEFSEEEDEEIRVGCAATLTNLTCYDPAHELMRVRELFSSPIHSKSTTSASGERGN